MKKAILGLALLVLSSSAKAQTTTIRQVSGNCTIGGCASATLQDSETFSYSDYDPGYGNHSGFEVIFSFRGITYYGQGSAMNVICPSGTPVGYGCEDVQDINNSLNLGQLHFIEHLKVRCYRTGCVSSFNGGSVTLSNDNFEIPVIFDHDYNEPCYYLGTPCYDEAGTFSGQVGLAVLSTSDTIVALTSSDPSIQVPTSVTIPAGAFSANFLFNTSVVQTQTVVIITATFPDGTALSVTVTEEPSPSGGE